MRISKLFPDISLLLSLVLTLSACGYSFQNSRTDLMEKEGVRKVYVRPLINNTYKPGVENTVYNALVRTILAHRKVKLVTSAEDADAVLEGTVTTAYFAASGASTADKLFPFGRDDIKQQIKFERLSRITVATVYTAALNCSFSLVRRENIPGRKKVLWSGGFGRSKPFPASNQLDVPGTTSALINESEFERALGEIATSMMEDLHESMLAMF
jgi:hypothetical protein